MYNSQSQCPIYYIDQSYYETLHSLALVYLQSRDKLPFWYWLMHIEQGVLYQQQCSMSILFWTVMMTTMFYVHKNVIRRIFFESNLFT